MRSHTQSRAHTHTRDRSYVSLSFFLPVSLPPSLPFLPPSLSSLPPFPPSFSPPHPHSKIKKRDTANVETSSKGRACSLRSLTRMCVCVCVCVCVVCVCESVCARTCLFTASRARVCLSSFILAGVRARARSLRMRVHTCSYACTHEHVCARVRVNVWMYLSICTYA